MNLRTALIEPSHRAHRYINFSAVAEGLVGSVLPAWALYLPLYSRNPYVAIVP